MHWFFKPLKIHSLELRTHLLIGFTNVSISTITLSHSLNTMIILRTYLRNYPASERRYCIHSDLLLIIKDNFLLGNASPSFVLTEVSLSHTLVLLNSADATRKIILVGTVAGELAK